MLNNWLSPVSNVHVSPYFSSVYHTKGEFPNLEDIKLVMVTDNSDFSYMVRQKLGLLSNNFPTKIIDIGCLDMQNNTSKYQVITELQDGYILPIFINANQDAFLEFCKAMSLENKLDLAAIVSNRGILGNSDYAIENIAFQRHLMPKYILEEITDSNNPGLSLGGLRSNTKILEPILREINYLHFDLAAIRKSDCPGVKGALPTGLFSEEACQIMRYAGEGQRLKLVTMDTHGCKAENEDTAMMVAELIWYLHEGLDIKPQDHPSLSSDFKEFIIELNEVDHSLVFLQSNKSGKWWLKKDEQTNKYISCAYEEYEQTINHEIPDRLLKLL